MAKVPKTYRKRKYCSVFGCLNSTCTNPELSYFSLPTDKERHLKWLQLIEREDLIKKLPQHFCVCEIHFSKKDICLTSSRKVLKKNSLPSLYLPHLPKDHPTRIDVTTADNSSQTEILRSTTEMNLPTSDSSCQTDMINISANETVTSLSKATPRKRTLRSESIGSNKLLRVHDSELTTLDTATSSQDTFYKLCDRFLSKDLAALVKAEAFFQSNQKGNRRSLTFKMFCLNLYYASPQIYRVLEKTTRLPCRSTLNKLCIPVTTEVDDKWMAVLKIKVNNMSEREKQCSLVMGSMSLKANLFYDIKNDKIIGFQEVEGVQSLLPANHALVACIRGIFVKWSQPIGFSLLSECSSGFNIYRWIDKLISKLLGIGLKIRVCISDLGSDMLEASKKKGISMNKTYFSVDNHKIYYIFDAPHLIKLIRNNLMTFDFHIQNGAMAKYEHIVKFYENDKNKDFKQAPKLTDSHINPTDSEKLEVRYATQLLSRSVASGLSTYIDFKRIEQSARSTVVFIKMMNDLFDVLNSSNPRDNYSHKSVFSGTEKQKDFLNNMLALFLTLKLRDPKNGEDVTQDVEFITGLIITIRSILQLHEDLKQEGYPYLPTRHLNHDLIAIFFREIRSKNGIDTEPTSRQFISTFRQIYFANIIRAPKESNGNEDLTEFFVHLRNHKSFKNDFKEIDNLPTFGNIDTTENTLREILRSDYAQLDLPKQNSFLYVCGALLKKCMERHNNCEVLKSYVDANQQACSVDSNLLVVPPGDFVTNVERMDLVVRKSFDRRNINSKIGKSIYAKLKDIEFSSPCTCFPKTFLVKLFIRMRMYFTLKFNNKVFRTRRNRRNLVFSAELVSFVNKCAT